MSDTKPKERAAEFVRKLRGIRENRGKLAALRRGLSEATVMDAWPVVASLGGNIDRPGMSTHVDIAALFASHPVESKHRNFGETCRAIALGGDGVKDLPEAYERRFRRLLSCGEPVDLTGQLRSWVRLAASRGVGVNYESLFIDLWYWRNYADGVRVKWARSFWGSGDVAKQESIQPSEES
jgi:CRISPR type I-E-associated protein CasB/Cse2